MAKTELFLFFSRLIKDYKIEQNPNESLPSLQGKIGLPLAPHPYTVIFQSSRATRQTSRFRYIINIEPRQREAELSCISSWGECFLSFLSKFITVYKEPGALIRTEV